MVASRVYPACEQPLHDLEAQYGFDDIFAGAERAIPRDHCACTLAVAFKSFGVQGNLMGAFEEQQLEVFGCAGHGLTFVGRSFVLIAITPSHAGVALLQQFVNHLTIHGRFGWAMFSSLVFSACKTARRLMSSPTAIMPQRRRTFHSLQSPTRRGPRCPRYNLVCPAHARATLSCCA
jgi:hypothetical protein